MRVNDVRISTTITPDLTKTKGGMSSSTGQQEACLTMESIFHLEDLGFDIHQQYAYFGVTD
ncbi:unnamed protein product [Arabidopsis lyrata]|uniref:Predicted protein n=1 Tax=Arabidopsis lyrata subsp. lyrata TaxID=81972 RepID=D7L9A9_ARALL|nr:predicted protein [Arabidopsis lyrata subsp. lyrata]CAH8262019.1 unnamed protein product [Arabidopsis lyrata]